MLEVRREGKWGRVACSRHPMHPWFADELGQVTRRRRGSLRATILGRMCFATCTETKGAETESNTVLRHLGQIQEFNLHLLNPSSVSSLLDQLG